MTGTNDADINEAQRNLYLKAKFYWQRTEETVVAVAGATGITMASAPKQIRFVIAPDGTFLAARPYNIQEQYITLPVGGMKEKKYSKTLLIEKPFSKY